MKFKGKFNCSTVVTCLFLLLMFAGFFLTPVINFRGVGSEVLKTFRNLEGLSIEEYPRAIINGLDNAWSTNLVFQDQYVDIFGLIQKGMNKTIIHDADEGKTVVKGNDGKLYFVSDVTDVSGAEALDNEGLALNAKKLNSLAGVFSEIDFMFVQAPFKYDSRYVTLPNGLEPFSNEPVDYFLEQLSVDSRVEILDLREEIEEDNKDYSTLFFVTDHHWNIDTAFWAYQKISSEVNDKFDYNIDEMYYDRSQWESVVYEDCFLGSQGTRVGSLYVGKDDLAIIYPKFDTSFIKTYNTKTTGSSVVREGSFTESVLEEYTPQDSDYTPTYNTYLYSDCEEIKVENNIPATDKKVLIVKDSFAVPVSAFLSTAFEETRVVDLRYLETGLDEYIADYEPDMVMFIYNPGAVTSSAFFEFEQ